MSTAMWTFEPFRRLYPSYPARAPLPGVDWMVRPSSMTAVGSASRPAATRRTSRRSWAMVSKHPAASHRRACWYTACHGGKSCGRNRHGLPVLTSQRRALNTSRRGWSRCPASSRRRVRYGAANAHSSSVTSLGYGFRGVLIQ